MKEVIPSPLKSIIPAGSHFELSYIIYAELLEQTDSSVLQYIQLHLPQQTKQQVASWLNTLEIKTDGKLVGVSTQLEPGQTLTIDLLNHFEQPVDTQWKLIWQNEEILAVHKPAPLAVSRTTRNLHDTLIGLVRRQTPFYKAQLLHRLDIETSGLILLAKDQESDIKWKKQLNTLIEKKVYHAIVQGTPTWQEINCENQLAERHDSLIRCKMYVVDESEPKDSYKKPKFSKTHFKCLKKQNGYSLIECRLYTGRKHQIRAHLADLGHPIIGDKIYAHQGIYFLKRLQSEQGLTSDDYLYLGAKNHLLRAVELGLHITDPSSHNDQFIQLNSPSFSDDITKEIYRSKTCNK